MPVPMADEVEYAGADIGLPREGLGSAASYGSRFLALVLDCLIAGGITWLFTAPAAPRNWSLITLFVLYTATTALMGRTPGMMLTGIGLASEVEGRPLGLPKAAARTVLLMLLIPAVVVDQNRRGLHDKVAGTVVVNAR